MTPTASAVLLPDAAAVTDLATFLGRAGRADPDGAARLVGHGDVLAVYVSPVHGVGGPTVLGLRTSALAAASDVDLTVPLAALTDRFARTGPGPEGRGGPVPLAVPQAADPSAVAWAGVTPPRRGWQPVGLVEPALLRRTAAAGIAEITAGSPAGSGGHAVAGLRAAVWGRPLADGLAVPAGAGYVAEVLGFVADGEPAALYRSGPWWRLSASRGHVLARLPAL